MSNLRADEKLIERIEASLCEAEKLRRGIEAGLETGFLQGAIARAAREISAEIGHKTFFDSMTVHALLRFAEDLNRAAQTERRTVCVQDDYGIAPPRIEHEHSETGSELLALRALALALAESINAVRWFLDAQRIAAELLESC
ncbi:hypothetical protein [Antarctobacter jejuensis]|uniref:hypothetical protein n=1 Tax=Antarctobacter jejuensis TaxID=1439938 RepID=UPI003FD2ADBE